MSEFPGSTLYNKFLNDENLKMLFSINLCLPDCNWVSERAFDLRPFDAGTDSGYTYMVLGFLFYYDEAAIKNLVAEHSDRTSRLVNILHSFQVIPTYSLLEISKVKRLNVLCVNLILLFKSLGFYRYLYKYI